MPNFSGQSPYVVLIEVLAGFRLEAGIRMSGCGVDPCVTLFLLVEGGILALMALRLRIGSRERNGSTRDQGERRTVASCGSVGVAAGLLVAPKLWFILIPGALILARNAWHAHAAMR